MKYVNRVRFPAACFAMVWAVAFPMGAGAADGPQQMDRLELDSSSVTGNQELPKVLYIVPWKEASIGELQGKPVNSLLNEVLAPLDREVFQREIRYYDQLYAADKAPEARSGQSEAFEVVTEEQADSATSPAEAVGSE